jgi:hypothetical protein
MAETVKSLPKDAFAIGRGERHYLTSPG